MVDVYHEFNFPKEMIASIKNALKPNGQLFLIEYRGEDSKVPIKKIHKMTEVKTLTYEIVLKTGKNREIRRIFDVNNIPIKNLKRIQVDKFKIGKMKIGQLKKIN